MPLVLMGALLGIQPTSAQGQTATVMAKAPTTLLTNVLLYRTSFIDRTARLAPCSFYRLMANPTDWPQGLPPWVQDLVGPNNLRPCEPNNAPVDTAKTGSSISRNIVVFDSVSVRDTIATVYATVVQGENAHREEYMAYFHLPDHWGVKEVRILGAMRIHYRGPSGP